MPIRNQSWYDLNESRPYPLSDEATGVDDLGVRLPSRLIADLHLAFPTTAGQRAMLGAVTVTPTLVTVTILATTSPSSPASFVPLVVISLVKPVDPHRQYPLEAQFPGAGGWITFGAAVEDAEETYSGRFSLASQSILLPSTVRAYEPLPIPSMSRLGTSTRLTGLITLLGGNDIEVVKECREIPSNPPPTGKEACDPNIAIVREVIVIRLTEDLPSISQRNVFDEYRGPCGGRPESDSCGNPVPIELLASVPPDCCGNIDIRLRGCVVQSEITEEALVNPATEAVISVMPTCGVVLDCGLGLGEACVTPDRLPDADGTLPNEFQDLCISESSITITVGPPDPPDPEESFTVPETSESAAINPALPYCNNFDAVDPDIIVETGDWDYLNIDGGGSNDVWATETGGGPALRNVSSWDFDFDTFYKRVSARIQMMPGLTGQRHNGGVMINYQETSPGSGRFSYYLAEVDWDSSANDEGFKFFRIAFFDGTTFNTILAVPIPTLGLNKLYEICLTVFANIDNPDGAWLYAQVIGLSDAIDVSIGPVSRANYVPSVGKFGMITNRAATRFHEFCVENSTDPPSIGCAGEPPVL